MITAIGTLTAAPTVFFSISYFIVINTTCWKKCNSNNISNNHHSKNECVQFGKALRGLKWSIWCMYRHRLNASDFFFSRFCCRGRLFFFICLMMDDNKMTLVFWFWFYRKVAIRIEQLLKLTRIYCYSCCCYYYLSVQMTLSCEYVFCPCAFVRLCVYGVLMLVATVLKLCRSGKWEQKRPTVYLRNVRKYRSHERLARSFFSPHYNVVGSMFPY